MMRAPLLLLLLILWNVECNLITKRAQLSSRRDGVGGIQVEDLYYFVGGFEFNDLVPSNIMDIYNVTSGVWEEPILLDEARGFISTTVSDEHIYFVGGSVQPSCAMMYNQDIHQYEDIGCGPTVRTAIQLSYHNDTLTVLGAFSADFFNASKQWHYKTALTSWMQQISGGAKLIHENLIVGIGGINATTSEQISDAWIFDTDTNELKVFNNAITATLDTLEDSRFTATSGRIVIFSTQANRYFVHEFGTTQWQEGFMNGIKNAAVLNDYMFLLNSTGSMIIDLNTMESKWKNGSFNFFVLENQVVLYSDYELFVYEDGQLITTLQLQASITLGVRWGDKYAFHDRDDYLLLYDPQTKAVSSLSKTHDSITVIIPFDNTTIVVFSSSLALIYIIENNTEINVQVGMSAAQLIGTDIVSASDNLVWINLYNTVSLNLTIDGKSALVDGSAIFGLSSQDYPYIDVLNHKTREWQPRISMTGDVLNYVGQSFIPVLVIDDVLIIGRKAKTWRYNITSEIMSVTTATRGWTTLPSVNTIPVFNHTGYLSAGASTFFVINSTAEVFHDSLTLTGVTKQFVTYNDTIFSTIFYNGAFYSVNTLDYLNAFEVDTLVLPAPQDSASLAVLDDILVVLGSDGKVYGMLLNDRLTWYNTSLQNDFVRTITVAMHDGTVMIAGGKHAQFSTFTDEILFINASAVVGLGGKISIKEPPTNGSAIPDNSPANAAVDGLGNTGLTEGELAAAIIVPVVVVIVGVIALVVILVKRKNKKNTSTAGLETRYGTWFIPFNQLTFRDQLGQGSSGQVFKGIWKSTTVALKVSMTQANTSVIAELELMMQLRPHPNVVQLLGFSVHPETDSIILVIEFCEGGSLDSKLYDTRDKITQREKVDWLIGIAKGLSHLHSNNIVHRDVAARNILVHRNEPKVTDFGMSRLVDEQNQHGTTKSELGPIRWMAPESLSNKEYSTMSDIWSFGILMFEVVVRQEPHQDADPIEIGRLIRDSGLTPVIPPTSSSCHPQLTEIMKQCWQMSSQSRPKIESIIQTLESIIVAE